MPVHPGVLRATACMRERLHEPLTVVELARCARLSPSHFVRTFASDVGRTPHRHLTLLRIRRATRLLDEGLPVHVVAARCGFSGTAHFSAVFLKETAIRPSRWRRRAGHGAGER